MTFLDDVELAPESEPDVIMRRTVAGRAIDLIELLLGRYALCIGPAGSQCYESQFTYDSRRGSAFAQADAIGAMAAWDGETEPSGWIRAFCDGRPTRRRVDGDAAQEEEAP
jgi:hypothetical protein